MLSLTLITDPPTWLDPEPFAPPAVQNCSVRVKLGSRRILVRARLAMADGEPRMTVIDRVDYDSESPISRAAMLAMLESEGRDEAWLETRLQLAFAKGAMS